MSKHSATTTSGLCQNHRPCMTPDGEYVCSVCGAVLSSEGAQSPSTQQEPRSNINLYLTHRLGGSPPKCLPGLSTSRSLDIAYREGGRKGSRRKKNVNSFLSCFSNACSKLGLTHAETEHGWNLFIKLYGEVPCGYVNTSEIACYAIAAGAASTTGGTRLINEAALVSAVRFSFHAKVVRDLYYIRKAIETRSQVPSKISVKPSLTASAKWMRGRY